MIDTISKPATKRPRRMAREPKPAGELATPPSTPTAEVEAKTAKPASKSSLVLAMLQRPKGATIAQIVTATGRLPHTTRATIAQIVTATGRLPHTTRAALTGLKKKGYQVTSEKAEDEERVYRVAAG
jgi:hypothetical protein